MSRDLRSGLQKEIERERNEREWKRQEELDRSIIYSKPWTTCLVVIIGTIIVTTVLFLIYGVK
jgi:hypothetical protein